MKNNEKQDLKDFENDNLVDSNEIKEKKPNSNKNKIIITAIVGVIFIVALGVGIYFALTSNNENEKVVTTETTTTYEQNFKDAEIERTDANKMIREISPKDFKIDGKNWDNYSILSKDVPVTVDNENYFKFVISKKIVESFSDEDILATVFISFDGKTIYYAEGSFEDATGGHGATINSKDLTKYKIKK